MRGGACSACGVVLAGLLALDFACTGHDGPERDVRPDEPAQHVHAVAPEDPGAELMRLQMRDHVITVHSAGDVGRTFTVASADGTVLASGIDADELARAFPDLHRELEVMTASGTCASRDDCPVLDASVAEPLGALPDAR